MHYLWKITYLLRLSPSSCKTSSPLFLFLTKLFCTSLCTCRRSHTSSSTTSCPFFSYIVADIFIFPHSEYNFVKLQPLNPLEASRCSIFFHGVSLNELSSPFSIRLLHSLRISRTSSSFCSFFQTSLILCCLTLPLCFLLDLTESASVGLIALSSLNTSVNVIK